MSFGERLSTRLFAAYLNAQGIKAKQYDAYAIGVTTNDNFVNAEVRGAGEGPVQSTRRSAAAAACPTRASHSCSCAPPRCTVSHPAHPPTQPPTPPQLPPTHSTHPPSPTHPQVNYQLTLPAVKEALTFKPGQERHLPIVTGFLGRGLQTGAITTLGRGGSDLTCTLLGASLGLPEVQVRTRTPRAATRCFSPPWLALLCTAGCAPRTIAVGA